MSFSKDWPEGIRISLLLPLRCRSPCTSVLCFLKCTTLLNSWFCEVLKHPVRRGLLFYVLSFSLLTSRCTTRCCLSSCGFVSSMPVISFGNTLTTFATEDASREDSLSLFFSVSFRGLDLGFCFVSSVHLGRGLYYMLRLVWSCGRCGWGLCRRLLWCFFIGVVYLGLQNEACISLRSQVYVFLHLSWRPSSPKSVNCARVSLEFEIRGVDFRVLRGQVCDKWPRCVAYVTSNGLSFESDKCTMSRYEHWRGDMTLHIHLHHAFVICNVISGTHLVSNLMNHSNLLRGFIIVSLEVSGCIQPKYCWAYFETCNLSSCVFASELSVVSFY